MSPIGSQPCMIFAVELNLIWFSFDEAFSIAQITDQLYQTNICAVGHRWDLEFYFLTGTYKKDERKLIVE